MTLVLKWTILDLISLCYKSPVLLSPSLVLHKPGRAGKC